MCPSRQAHLAIKQALAEGRVDEQWLLGKRFKTHTPAASKIQVRLCDPFGGDTVETPLADWCGVSIYHKPLFHNRCSSTSTACVSWIRAGNIRLQVCGFTFTV